MTPYNKAGRAHRLKYNELFDVGNIDVDGSVVDLSSPRGQANKVGNLSESLKVLINCRHHKRQ